MTVINATQQGMRVRDLRWTSTLQAGAGEVRADAHNVSVAAYTDADDGVRRRTLFRLGDTLIAYDRSAGLYRPVSRDSIYETVTRELAAANLNRSRFHRLDVRDHIVADAPVLSLQQEPPLWLDPADDDEREHDWCAFADGVVDLTQLTTRGDLVMRRQSSRYLTTCRVPWEYPRNAAEPTLWLKCLDQWTSGGDEQQTLQEFAGYCLLPRITHHRALFLEGDGGDGKSTFCGAIRWALGPQNVASIGIMHFHERFWAAELRGKLANISIETHACKWVPTTEFKGLIAGDPISSERKREHPFTFVPRAKHIYAWNRRPLVGDSSEGFWRRVLLVPFKPVGFAPDPELGERLRRETPGILRWMLDGLVRLQCRGAFTETPRTTAAAMQYRHASDTVLGFLSQRCELRADAATSKTDLWVAYAAWCVDHDLKAADAAAMRSGLTAWSGGRVTADRVRLPDGQRPWCWRGLALRPD